MSFSRHTFWSFLVLCIFSFNFVLAAEEDLWDRPLEELLNVKVVSGTRKENSSLRLPMVVTVLTGQELRRWGAENLADGLRTAAGMQIRKAPGDFPQYRTAVRGNTADFMNIRTLFLLDGVPMQNPNAGFDPGWIPLSIVKRVEIVKGPESGIYGANAFGGLINIITRSGGDSTAAVTEGHVTLRSHNDVLDQKEVPGAAGSLQLGNKKEDWDYFTSVQYSGDQNTPRAYAGYHEHDVFGKFRHQLSERLSYSLRGFLSLDRNQMAMTEADSMMKNDFTHLAGTLNYRVGEASDLEFTTYLNQFRHFLKYNNNWDKYENIGQLYGFHSQLSTPLGEKHVLTSGIDYSEASGRLEFNWGNERNHTYGVYSQYEYLGWDQYLPLLGVRYDQNSTFGNAWSPRAGLSYLISDQATLYTIVGRGFRAPIFNETHIQAYGKIGNPHLDPENTTTYEVGLKTVYETSQNAVSIFKQDITKQINLVPVDPAAPTGNKTFENSGTVSIVGLELDGNYKPRSDLRLFYNATFLRSDNGTGKRIERIIDQKMVLGATWTLDRWKNEFVAIHEGNQFFYSTSASIPSDAEGRVFLAPVTTMNIETTYDLLNHKTLSVFIDNLTDQKYTEVFSTSINKEGFYLSGRTVGVRLDAKF